MRLPLGGILAFSGGLGGAPDPSARDADAIGQTAAATHPDPNNPEALAVVRAPHLWGVLAAAVDLFDVLSDPTRARVVEFVRRQVRKEPSLRRLTPSTRSSPHARLTLSFTPSLVRPPHLRPQYR